MSFFRNIQNALSSPSFYDERLREGTGRAFKYYFLLIISLAVILTVVFNIKVQPVMYGFAQNALGELVNTYPSELEIAIKDGKVATNVNEPYAIPLSAEWRTEDTKVSNLIVINTKAEPTPQSLTEHDTIALLTESYIIYMEEGGKVSSQSLASFSDITVNSANVQKFAGKILPLVKFLIPLLAIVSFIGIFAANFVVLLIHVAIAALIAWILFAITKAKSGYGDIFKLGLYAVTAWAIIKAVLIIFSIAFPWYIGVLLIIVLMFIFARPAIVRAKAQVQAPIDNSQEPIVQ